MEDFKCALKDLEKAQDTLNELKKFAVKLGMMENGMNAYNAASVCFKALNEFLVLQQKAEELGTTLPNCLKSYRMRNKTTAEIPPEMNFAPPHWVTEASTEKEYVWKNSRRIEKFYRIREVTPAAVQRLRAGLQPQISSLFSLLEEKDWDTEEKEAYKQAVVNDYKTSSYQEFSSHLVDALWSMSVEGDPEEEINESDPQTLDIKLETCTANY